LKEKKGTSTSWKKGREKTHLDRKESNKHIWIESKGTSTS
jgi:hypothetical protein